MLSTLVAAETDVDLPWQSQVVMRFWVCCQRDAFNNKEWLHIPAFFISPSSSVHGPRSAFQLFWLWNRVALSLMTRFAVVHGNVFGSLLTWAPISSFSSDSSCPAARWTGQRWNTRRSPGSAGKPSQTPGRETSQAGVGEEPGRRSPHSGRPWRPRWRRTGESQQWSGYHSA